MSTTPARTTAPGPVRTRALAVAAAVLADVLIWLIAHSVLDIDLRVPDGATSTTTELLLPAVLIGSAVISLLGWGLLALLEKLTGRGRALWTGAASVVLVLSLVAPLLGAGLTPGNRITLVLLHLAVGAILIPAFRRSPAVA